MASTFQSIVLLANEMHKKMCFDPSSPSSVYIYDDHLPCLHRVIRDFVSNTAYKPEIMDIETTKIDFINDNLDGIFTRSIRNNGVYIEILIRNELSSLWERFVETKELTHILMDGNEENHTSNMEELITFLLAEQPTFRIDSDMESEHLAMYFATELLVPFCYNGLLFTKSNPELSQIFKVPQKTIEILKSEWYQSARKEAYKDLEIEHETIAP